MLIYKNSQIDKIFKKINNIDTLIPFNNLIFEFFYKLNQNLKKNKKINIHPDLAYLNFWLRPSNLKKIILEYESLIKTRARIGILFHLCPSNTPLNFFYSFFFGLITGNINIVRLPSKNYVSIEILLNEISKIFRDKKFFKIKNNSYFISYDKNAIYTEKLSKIADLRIIWGGDSTVNSIRNYKLKPRSREITFADRISCAIINSSKYNSLPEKEKKKIAQKFYNDAYFLDQNACSSPHVIFWIGNNLKKSRFKFWNYVSDYAKNNYNQPDIATIDKLSNYYDDIIEKKINNKLNLNSFTYNILLNKIDPKYFNSLRGKWGYFYEYNLKKIEFLNKFLDDKVQTLIYFGIDHEKVFNQLRLHKDNAVDRIVPIGNAHQFTQNWDGYDLILSMTRKIDHY